MRESDKWFHRIVRDSRYNDRKAGREIDPKIPFICSKVLFEMQNVQQNRCWYCLEGMSWMERSRNLRGLTVERSDNSLPHYTSNCKGLVCKSCNSKRYTTERGILKRYFSKWKDFALGVHVQVGDLETGRRASLIF